MTETTPARPDHSAPSPILTLEDIQDRYGIGKTKATELARRRDRGSVGRRRHRRLGLSGWGANWMQHARHIEGAYNVTDVLVLSYFVRTNLGRRLRRTSGEAGLFWSPCRGHGRDAILRSINSAVDVVASQRESTT